MRIVNTRRVSNSGTIKMAIDMAGAEFRSWNAKEPVLTSLKQIMSVARIKPIISDPVSPMKILFSPRERLNLRKPRRVPASASDIIVKPVYPESRNQAARVSEAIIPVDAASPSMPSIRLTALIITTTMKTVEIYVSQRGIWFIPRNP